MLDQNDPSSENDPIDFLPNALLKFVRKKKAMTQAEVAAEIGIDRGLISRFENFHVVANEQVVVFVEANRALLTAMEEALAADEAEKAAARRLATNERAARRGKNYEDVAEAFGDAVGSFVEAIGNEVDLVTVIDPKLDADDFNKKMLMIEYSPDMEVSQEDDLVVTQAKARQYIRDDVIPMLAQRLPESGDCIKPALPGMIWCYESTAVPGIYFVAASGTAEGEETFNRAVRVFLLNNRELIEQFIDPSRIQ